MLELEGTLLEVARLRACCAFGFDDDILGNDLGAVRYKNRMNICPNSPKGPIAIGISAWSWSYTTSIHLHPT
eukprot:scaffold4918_cov46-Cyclotella_meneghiniana.AAC.1